MGKVFTHGQTAKSTLAVGTTTSSTVKPSSQMPQAGLKKEFGNMEQELNGLSEHKL